ncbi:hypothetical protein ACWOFR_04720 [Carnobacterium gallinarum]|uniref:hypothetical protein n=1 Tax=Carnobacterium gallinarum TaxID=2749 RepID=UPI00068C3AA1|nr:hypothetical protein [Carnobacterium gallinarum]
MKISTLQEQINQMDYWDSQILDFSINYFGDEVSIAIENDDETDYVLKLLTCYSVSYENDARNRWNNLDVRNMSREQLGYFAHDISVKESSIENFIEIDLQLPSLFAKVTCKNIEITKIEHADKNYFWNNNTK